MMEQQRMGVPLNNNQGQPAPRKPGSAVGVRNFLVGTPANDEKFSRGEAINDQEFGVDSNVSYVPGAISTEKKYDTTGAIDIAFKESPSLSTTGEHPGILVGDPVQIRETTGEHPGIMIGDPVQVKEGTTDPERTKEALDKLEKVKANRGGFLKGLRERMGVAQEKMEKVAAKVGKAVEAYNNLPPKTKLAIGLTLTAGSMIGVASGATFLAGGIGILRLAMKGASTVAMYQGLEGMLDKKYAELDNVSEVRKKFMKVGALATAALVNFGLTDALNNTGVTEKMAEGMAKLGNMLSATSAPLPVDTMGNPVAPTDNKDWIVGSTGNQEVPIAKDPLLERRPGEGNVYTPGQQTLPVGAGLGPGEELIRSEGSLSFDQNPAYGIDAASALPVGSVESLDKNDRTAITETSPVRDQFALGVEESFAPSNEAPATVTTTPQTGEWGASDGSRVITSDGAPVQSGASLETKAVTPQSATDAFVKADAVVIENTIAPTSPSNQISFAPNATLSAQDMSNLSALNTLTSTEKFDTAITTAARQIDSAKSFLSFGDGSAKIKESFITVLQNNPSVSVDTLLTADISNLSGREGASLKEAQGILKRIIPEDVLAQGSVRESSVVSVLQENFTA